MVADLVHLVNYLAVDLFRIGKALMAVVAVARRRYLTPGRNQITSPDRISKIEPPPRKGSSASSTSSSFAYPHSLFSVGRSRALAELAF
jgi:hypothetical protein